MRCGSWFGPDFQPGNDSSSLRLWPLHKIPAHKILKEIWVVYYVREETCSDVMVLQRSSQAQLVLVLPVRFLEALP